MNKYKIFTSKLFLFSVIVAITFVSFGIAREMYKAYQMDKEMEDMDEEIGELKKERVELNESIAYFQTNSFVNLDNRKRSNKIRPDEQVWILKDIEEPELDNSEVLSDDNLPLEEEEGIKEEGEKENWRLWLNLFFENGN